MPSKNIPVNGWPQIKELDKVTPILAELDKIETWQKSVKQETKSGTYVEFTNALALDASSVIAEITASQDLHGYDKPWVGGVGKNKLDFKAALDYWGATYTDNGDGSYTVTAIGNSYTNPYEFLDTAAAVSISVASIEALQYAVNWRIQIYDETNGRWEDITSESLKYENITAKKIRLNYSTQGLGIIVSDLQIELGSAATSYEPYANICPITGFSTVTITDVDSESHTATVTVSLGSTVYGGTLDLTSGVLTVTHAIDTLTSADQLSGTAPQTSANGNWMGMNLTASPVHETANISLMCSNCEAISFNDRLTADSTDRAYINDVNDIAVLRLKKDTAITTKSDFFAHFENAQVVYTLATPTTTTLTAEQLEMVKGYNRISANSGDIEVTAYTGNTWN